MTNDDRIAPRVIVIRISSFDICHDGAGGFV